MIGFKVIYPNLPLPARALSLDPLKTMKKAAIWWLFFLKKAGKISGLHFSITSFGFLFGK